jgi:hypothetical protein
LAEARSAGHGGRRGLNDAAKLDQPLDEVGVEPNLAHPAQHIRVETVPLGLRAHTRADALLWRHEPFRRKRAYGLPAALFD